MKIFTIIGARPQFIKAAAVSRAFLTRYPMLSEVLVHTGQHFDANMSQVFFDELHIPTPRYNLGVGGGTHGQNTGRMLEKIESLLIKEKPDYVLVYGDTDSTLAGALAASKLHIPIIHIEAGLRSFNRLMPEEINRVLTDHLSSILFVPSELARKNLLNEGIADNKIHIVGDVMYDSVLYYKSLMRKPIWFESLNIKDNEFILCTIHRAENTASEIRMSGILKGLADSNRTIILPLHPRSLNALQRMKLVMPRNIHVVEPVGYLEMGWLQVNCRFVVTDSGGVQKEAYFHGKPCVTLRDETEWVELVAKGVNYLVGSDSDRITAALAGDPPVISDTNLYGNGNSAQIISDLLVIQHKSYSSKMYLSS